MDNELALRSEEATRLKEAVKSGLAEAATPIAEAIKEIIREAKAK